MKSSLDLPYRQTPQRALRLDLHVPAGVLRPPLVMWIPMQGMRACPKECAPLWIVKHGFALASIECRTSEIANAPAAVMVCKAAIRWLRVHATKYGFNGESIGVWGHSAGGLLAALLATSGDAPQLDEKPNEYSAVSSKVQAACDECGAPHDLSYFARPEIQARFPAVTENLRLYLGGKIEENLELAHLISPSTYITRACPPLLLMHGDADGIVPVQETIEFHRALVEQNVDATLQVLRGTGHSWEKSLTCSDTLQFFERTLR
jgi:acetyl esterase/lipase